MVEKLCIVLVVVIGATHLIRAEADPEPERDKFGRVVDHRNVKKYFLELYNEALTKAMREQEEADGGYSRNSEKRGFNFGESNFSGYDDDKPPSFKPSSFYNPEFNSFGEEKNQEDYPGTGNLGFASFGGNTHKTPVLKSEHVAQFSGGHHHKHHHHKHSHQHKNDHKHAHKHLHEQSHEHKHSAKHQHVHKHEHHHEHNHHHKHKEDHEHKQDHKHAHKHIHAHKGSSWRRQGEEGDIVDRREDSQDEFEPINAEMQVEGEIFEPQRDPANNFMKKAASERNPSHAEYQDIEFDTWEQI